MNQVNNEEILTIKEEATTSRTIRNIRKTLESGLKIKYNIENEKIINNILNIHGLEKSNFDFVKNLETHIQNKINDVSIDDNSNKNEKTIKGLLMEISSPIEKAVGYDLLYQVMKEIYGKLEAKRLSGEMYDFSLAISDSTKLAVPYCWSFDASKIVIFGRPFGQLESNSPKRVSSYIAALSETIHQMSSHLAGAIAIGTFFMDVAHLMIYKEKITLSKVIEDGKIRKYIENEYQQFVHSVNHLSRNGLESPFTNLSIFDHVKLRNFLNEDNYGWYFNEDLVFDESDLKVDTDKKDYIIHYIMELQKIFLEFFNKGNPKKNGMPYRFPIVTLNISKKLNGDTKAEDIGFLEYISSLDIFRFNIFTSEGNKIASCCRLVNNTDMMNLASQVNSFGGGSSVSLGSHRVLTINFNRIALESKTEEHYYNILEKRIEDSIKILNAHRRLIQTTVEKGLQMFMKIGWIDLKKMFSTIGMLGLVEANETMIEKGFLESKDNFIEDSLKFLNRKINEISLRDSIYLNIEQIPAESMANRLCEVDKLLYKNKVPYQMYSNQFVPLWKNATIWERMEIDGKYNQLLTGGGIVHIQIGEKITQAQAKRIIKYAIECGCEHFALNAVYSECINKHVTLGKHENCPKCKEKVNEYYTRVVGYFVPVSSWNKPRREWEFNERKFVDLKKIQEN